MGDYKIKQYSYDRAKELNVKIKPSKHKLKKIDVYNIKDVFIVSIGANGYKDYPTYIEERGKEYAYVRRKLYKQRHEKDRHILGSAGYFSDKLLW